ncbi:ribosomal RNA small subunit methyltransferase A [Candidatus Peregrinibacteria bacterium CG10_big_fil_rev_8_21_14_0_10_55_24]|nr:MAG: ribosomal RNA small subunit methyltransferase A [Candidatus Peregrinibacteria bacterium CG10_big_fil_rev_8_21_14_0_10_55_24]
MKVMSLYSYRKHCQALPMADLAQEIRQFCSRHGLKLNTDLGQHFLTDASVLQRIVEAAHLTTQDHVVEIGPGIGALTRELLKQSKHVTAIELDERMLPLLMQFVTQHTDAPTNLTLIHENALHVPFPKDPYKIVANIPYHITSPLLRHAFLESATTPQSMTLLIQREVAEKICDTENAGLLTILVGLFGTPNIIALVPPQSFLPPPKVDSAVLHIECFSAPLTSTQILNEIFRLTKIAFGQKRKMLRNTLGAFPGGMERLERASVAASRRPQTLSIAEWIRLAEIFGEDRSHDPS